MTYCCLVRDAWDDSRPGGREPRHNVASTAKVSLRIMRPRFLQRQTRCVFPVRLLWCILSCATVYANNEEVSTMARYLRQLPVKSVDGLSQPMAVQQDARDLSIFGRDGRQQISDPSAYPYTTVGLLHWGTDDVCTGTLVAANIILTAAECVLDSDGELRDNPQGSSVFTLSETTEAQTASVIRVHKQSDFWTKWTQNTYVLVELDEDLGATNGVLHLPTANSFAQDEPMTVQLVDYGSSAEAGECFQMCKIHFPSEFGGPDYMLHHDCDVSAKRSAGSPMLIRSTDLETYVVGIHTNAIGDDQIEDTSTTTYPSFNDTVANRGVLGSFVQPHLDFLLQQSRSSSTSLDSSSSLSFSQASGSGLTSPTGTLDSSSSSSSDNQEKDNQRDSGASAALGPASASSSSVETSVSSHQGIASTAAYTCIGAVCASWLAIIFVAARKFRASR